MTSYTILEYQYRDAGNYKAFGELLLEGEMTPSDLADLTPYLYDGEYFIPEEVDIPPLQPLLWEEFGGPGEDDHEWHTFEKVRTACAEDREQPIWGTKEDLFQRIQDKKQGQEFNKHAV